MRSSGITFKQASADILQDTVQLTDILSQPSPKKIRRDRSPRKGEGKGKSDRPTVRTGRFLRSYYNQPYHNNFAPPLPANPSWQATPVEPTTAPTPTNNNKTSQGQRREEGQTLPAMATGTTRSGAGSDSASNSCSSHSSPIHPSFISVSLMA